MTEEDTTEAPPPPSGDQIPQQSRVSSKRRRVNPSPADTEHTDVFIVEEQCMHQALCDLHRDEESLMFKNASGDIEFLIQPTSEPTDEYMTFDVCIVYDELSDAHGKIAAMMAREYGSMENEDGNWTLFVFSMQATDPSAEDLAETMKYLNALYNMRYCECFEYFVKSPDRPVCYMCTIRGRTVSTDPRCPDSIQQIVECVICNDPVRTRRGVVEMRACCSQLMHRRCVELWRKDDATKVCPVCRSRSPTTS